MISTLTHIYARGIRILERSIEYICVVFLSSMVTIVLYGVFMRYVMKSAVAWAEEAPIYMMIWVAFLAGSLGIRKGTHIGVEVFVNFLPDRPRTVIHLFTSVCILFFLYVLFDQGFNMCINGFKYQMSTSLQISMGWAILAVPVGAILMMLEIGQVIMESIGDLSKKM